MTMSVTPGAEWLEADGLGGFASGSADGIRRRRYHALLLSATTPPTGRMVLVNGLDAELTTAAGTAALSSQMYAPDVVHPDGARRIESFTPDPWPRWRLRARDGTAVEHEIFVPRDAAMVALTWRLVRDPAHPAEGAVRLRVRPFLSGRDYHALHHENPAFRFTPERDDDRLVWRPYDGVPAIVARTNGAYAHEPVWYRNFLYVAERARGLDCTEDLAAPGVFTWDLAHGEAVLILEAEGPTPAAARASVASGAASSRPESPRDPVALLHGLRAAERRRRERCPSRLQRAADAYLVRRGAGKTIIAGYPWFTDWGRDTFIALRGLCLATGRLADARAILLTWAPAVSDGMLPNCFLEGDGAPEFNAVDASLWYVIAVDEYLRASAAGRERTSAADARALRAAVDAILDGYARGTRFGIRLDDDGLIAAGEPGVQLTWMDAKVGDWVVTPRVGKPVEVQALWLNALRIAGAWSERWTATLARGTATFRARFWNDAGYLHDVVDPDHRAGAVDATFRPNQILAVGGLPHALLDGAAARAVVDAVEARLLTPIGLRSLAPTEPGYAPRYQGGPCERDAAYHQGTVWPWLIGPFVEAWVRVRGGTPEAKREARTRYLAPLLRHLDVAGLGHLPEIASGDPPHTPAGCPFQAWSVGEALRLASVVLAADDVDAGRASA